jgi:hypothetical protein
MKLYPEVGDKPDYNLSTVVFGDGYVIPTASDLIASGYQKGFPVEREILDRWREGESHDIAAAFVMHYYQSMGHGEGLSVKMTGDHPDMIGGVVVSASTADSLDWVSHTVWPSDGRLCIEDNR